MARYAALTSLDGGASCYIVVLGDEEEPKEAVEERATRAICGDQWDQAKDITTDTQLKNLFILPMSQVKRRYSQELTAFLADEPGVPPPSF